MNLPARWLGEKTRDWFINSDAQRYLDGPWQDREDVEAATAEWVHWFNTDRLHSMLNYNTPTEVEAAHYTATETIKAAAYKLTTRSASIKPGT